MNKLEQIEEAFEECGALNPSSDFNNQTGVKDLSRLLMESKDLDELIKRCIMNHQGMLLAYILGDVRLCSCLLALSTYCFEAGRLYGRSELIRELEPKE